MSSETDMWQSYNAGDRSQLVPLLNSMKNVREHWVNKFSGAPIPRSSISSEVTRNMISAFDTYNPDRGTQLNTHVNNYLKKTNRFIYEHQNIGRIPENRIVKVNTYNTAINELSDRLGREPNVSEVSDHLKWSNSEVERMNRDLRSDLSLDETADMSFVIGSDPRRGDLARYIYAELDPREKYVYEHTTGIGGKRIFENKEIAKRLNVSPGMVSQIKNRITAKIMEHE